MRPVCAPSGQPERTHARHSARPCSTAVTACRPRARARLFRFIDRPGNGAYACAMRYVVSVFRITQPAERPAATSRAAVAEVGGSNTTTATAAAATADHHHHHRRRHNTVRTRSTRGPARSCRGVCADLESITLASSRPSDDIFAQKSISQTRACLHQRATIIMRCGNLFDRTQKRRARVHKNMRL